VDGEKKSVHYFLKEGDRITINNKQLTKNKENANSNNNLFDEVEIVDENPDYLVIEKPAGMVMHPVELPDGRIHRVSEDDKHKSGTLANFVLQEYPEVAKVGEDPNRPGIVHRLDKEVSGLVVVARNQDMFDHLKKQFKQRIINKEYIALVYGEVKPDEDRIDLAISRSKSKGIFVAKHENDLDENSKRVITDINVIERFNNFTLLRVKILTGRTHQIRVHLKSIGHSVVGDNLYITHDVRLKKKQVDLGRIFLHAGVLGFEDLAGEYKEFRSELPKELKDFLYPIYKIIH